MKGQTAVELVVILAVSLLILYLILSISSQYLAELGSSNIMTQASTSVNDLATAAKQVYYQGQGARQQVFITIPEGVDASKSGITNRTIDLNVLGSDVIARTDFDIRGKIPTTPGGYTVWVTAENGYVLIGMISLDAEPNPLVVYFFSKNQSQSSQSVEVFTNNGNSSISVSLQLNFTQGDVNVSLSNPADTGFSLQSGEARQVPLNFNVSQSAFGTYSGVLYANASNGDEVAVDIIVYVMSQVCNATVSCPPAILGCTASYAVIGTYRDASYISPKEVFDTAEYVTLWGTGWANSSQVTVNIIMPGGSSAAGYPKLVQTYSNGSFSDQWNTVGAVTGVYTVHTNDSQTDRYSTFNITGCT